MRRVSDSEELKTPLAISRCLVWPSPSVDMVGVPDDDFLSSIPGMHLHLSTLGIGPSPAPAHDSVSRLLATHYQVEDLPLRCSARFVLALPTVLRSPPQSCHARCNYRPRTKTLDPRSARRSGNDRVIRAGRAGCAGKSWAQASPCPCLPSVRKLAKLVSENSDSWVSRLVKQN